MLSAFKARSSLLKFFAGILVAALSALAVLLVLAAVAALFCANDTVLKVFSVATRMVAACACAFFFCDGTRAMLKGFLSGVASFAGVFVVYSIFSGFPELSEIAVDLLFLMIFSLCFSILFVNFKKPRDNC